MNFFGWVCPKCRRPLSPFVSACPYCTGGGEKEVNEKAPEAATQEEKLRYGLPKDIMVEWLEGEQSPAGGD